MTAVLSALLHGQRGTLSIDWTLVAAACVGMGLAFVALVSGS